MVAENWNRSSVLGSAGLNLAHGRRWDRGTTGHDDLRRRDLIQPPARHQRRRARAVHAAVKRYGKDHLYVTAQGGRDVGRVDLVTGHVRVTEPDLVIHFDAAVRAWCDEHSVTLARSREEKLPPVVPPSLEPVMAPDLPPPPEPPHLDDMPPPPVPLSSASQPSTAPTVAPAPEWHDLATNRAGQAARE